MQQPVDRPDDTPQVKTKPTFWLRYSFWVFTAVYVVAITTGAIVLLVALGLAVVPQPVRTALQTWSIHNIFLKTDIVYVSPEAPEQSAVVSDKSNIENWLAECAHASSVFSLPGSVRNALEEDDKTAVSAQSSAPLLNHTAMRITRLTHDIGIARVAQAEKTQTFYVGEQVAIFITISLGLVTTILVAVSSADLFKRDSGRGIAIRVGAIAFPAIGTAVAALIAFYNPSASYGRASHALLSLKQLQGQMVTGLLKTEALDCRVASNSGSGAVGKVSQSARRGGKEEVPSATSAEQDPWKELSNRVDAWEQRYRDILDASTADGPAPSAQSTANPASGPSDANADSAPPQPMKKTAPKPKS